MQWPTHGIPAEFLALAQRLLKEQHVTNEDFLRLCKIAVDAIDSGQVPLYVRSDMALYIASLWLNNKNISENSLLDEIGGAFGELEIPGSFMIGEGEPYERRWSDIKSWIHGAQENMKDVDE